MKIEAYKAEDDTIFENEKDCRKHNIKLRLKEWLSEPKSEYSTCNPYDAYANIAISRIAEKIVNNKKSFNEVFSKLLEL